MFAMVLVCASRSRLPSFVKYVLGPHVVKLFWKIANIGRHMQICNAWMNGNAQRKLGQGIKIVGPCMPANTS